MRSWRHSPEAPGARRRLASARIFAVVLTAAPGLACGAATPASLDASSNVAELSAFTGREPVRCVYSGPNVQLCSWRLGPEDRGFDALAGSLEAAGALTLLCEVPIDGRPRAEGSCTALARQGETLPPVGAASPGVESTPAELRAREQLERAKTLRTLSELLGDVPESCRTGADAQTCDWQLAAADSGRGVVAALVGRSGSLRLRCVVPLDGSPRAAGSCAPVAPE